MNCLEFHCLILSLIEFGTILYVRCTLFQRMTAYFTKTGWPANAPASEQERKEFIASLHKRKTELFMALIEKKLLPLRPGVAKLVTIFCSFILHPMTLFIKVLVRYE